MSSPEWLLSRAEPRRSKTENEPTIRGMPASMYPDYLKSIPQFLTRRQKELTDSWLEFGRHDPNIKTMINPPFDLGSFTWWKSWDEQSRYEICRQFFFWSKHPGDAVVIGELCFIKSKEDEWLAFHGKRNLGMVSIGSDCRSTEEARKEIGRLIGEVRSLPLLEAN